MSTKARRGSQTSLISFSSGDDRNADHDSWSSGINTPSRTPSTRDDSLTEKPTDGNTQAKTDPPSAKTHANFFRKQWERVLAATPQPLFWAYVSVVIVLISIYLSSGFDSGESYNSTPTVTVLSPTTVTKTRFIVRTVVDQATKTETETHLALPTKLDSSDFWRSALSPLVPTATTVTTTETATGTITATTTMMTTTTATVTMRETTTISAPGAE
jgi:hypothetical protein